jgi:uncharacterized protein
MIEEVLEVLDEQQCQTLIRSRNIGRIAFELDGAPEIFPINYIADGTTVVFRTAEDTRLRDAVKHRVAFEVDDWDPNVGVGWSVVVKGVAEEITRGIDPFAIALRSHPVIPLVPGAREIWIAVYPSEITGCRFRR